MAGGEGAATGGWKKVIVSGSQAHLAAVTASYFVGDGSQLTGLTSADVNPVNCEPSGALNGSGTFTANQSGNSSVALSVDNATTTAKGVASFSSANFGVSSGAVTIKDGGVANAELANSSITINGTAISLGGSVTTPNDNDQLTNEQVQDIVGAMFTSTNTETGITATYQDSTGDIDLVVGTLNQDTTGNAATATALASGASIRTNLASTSAVNFDGTTSIAPGVTGTLPVANGGTGLTSLSTFVRTTGTQTVAGNKTFSNNVIVSGNFTVNGTTTTVNTTNLNVTDKFINLNDGGSAADGGIVIEGQGTAFGWDESASRWTFDFSGASYNDTTIASDAYAAAVAISKTDTNYQKIGNIHVDAAQDGNIWIWA
jgi:hypothetical protein